MSTCDEFPGMVSHWDYSTAVNAGRLANISGQATGGTPDKSGVRLAILRFCRLSKSKYEKTVYPAPRLFVLDKNW